MVKLINWSLSDSFPDIGLPSSLSDHIISMDFSPHFFQNHDPELIVVNWLSK
jgi:hypothetical protein